MRKFLPKIMVDITRHPRQIFTWSEIQWSKSWVVNVFRIYEFFFGRKVGIRAEASCIGHNQDDRLIYHYSFFTVEAFLAHVEGMVREFLATRKLAFKFVPVPQYAIVGLPSRQPIFSFAIAIDNSEATLPNTGTSPVTHSYTVTGSNPAIFDGTDCNDITASTDIMTGVTYAGSSSTKVNATQGSGGNNVTWLDLFFLPACATGSNNIVETFNTGTGKTFVTAGVASYSGVANTTIDGNVGSSGAAITTLTNVITSIADNCWHTMFVRCNNNNPSAGSGTTQRSTNPSADGRWCFFDSNGVIHPAGSNTLTINFTIDTAFTTGATFAPFVGSTVNSGFFFAASK